MTRVSSSQVEELTNFLHHLNSVREKFQFSKETERHSYLLPTHTAKLIAHCSQSTASKHTPTLTSMPTPTTTLPTNRLWFQSWWKRPNPCLITKPTWRTGVLPGHFQAEMLRRPADLTGYQFTEGPHRKLFEKVILKYSKDTLNKHTCLMLNGSRVSHSATL
jgi:hypothetical protein